MAKEQPRLQDFPFSVEIPIRYSDLDTLKHVNNVAIADLYQEARVQFHREVFRQLRRSKLGDDGLDKVLAELRISYLRETHFPHPVVVGVGLVRLGNSSYTIYEAMYQQGQLVGTCNAVMVYFKDGKSFPIPDESRAILANYMMKEN